MRRAGRAILSIIRVLGELAVVAALLVVVGSVSALWGDDA